MARVASIHRTPDKPGFGIQPPITGLGLTDQPTPLSLRRSAAAEGDEVLWPVEQRSTTSYYTPYTFSAKERDLETGYSYFGARYYSSDISVWLSVDPMAGQYSSTSGYMYVLGKPNILIDPNGMFSTWFDAFWYKLRNSPLASIEKQQDGSFHIIDKKNSTSYHKPNTSPCIAGQMMDSEGIVKSYLVVGRNIPPGNAAGEDYILSHDEAVENFRFGKGKRAFVDLSLLDLSKVHSSDFKTNEKSGKKELLVNFYGEHYTNLDQALVYGSITLELIDKNIAIAKPDLYNFDLKLQKGTIKRDIQTGYASSRIGPGTAFEIIFLGIAEIDD